MNRAPSATASRPTKPPKARRDDRAHVPAPRPGHVARAPLVGGDEAAGRGRARAHGVDLADVGDARRSRRRSSRSSSSWRGSRSARSRACRNWFFVAFAVGALLNLWSSTKPIVDVGGISLSMGALERMGALHRARGRARHLGRAHRLDDTARRGRARARTLVRPLRWLRLPVDEWVDRDRTRDPVPAAAHRRDPHAGRGPAAAGPRRRTSRESPRAAIRNVLGRDARPAVDRDRHVDPAGTRPRGRDRRPRRPRRAAATSRARASGSSTAIVLVATHRAVRRHASRCYISEHATRPARPHRPAGLPDLPRHDDLRPAGRRGRVARDPRPRRRPRRDVPRHRRRVPARRRPHDRRAAPRRSSAAGSRASATSYVVATKCFGPIGRNRGTWATAAATSWTRSTRRCAGCRPTSSTCTSCTSTTPACRSTRRSARSTISCASGKVRYIGCSNFLAYRLARALGRSEALGLARFVSVQPRYNLVVPRVRARAVPAVPRRGHRRDPLQPDRGRDALGQARPHEGARRRHALHARQRGADVPGPLLARQRVRHRRRAREARRRRGHAAADARGRVDAAASRRSRRRSSARAGPSSSTRRSPRSTRGSTTISSTG